MTGMQAQGGASPQGFAALVPFIPFILLFVVFYFLLIKPQKKKQKELVMMLDSLKKGKKVVTTSGIFGTIVDIKDDTISLQISEKITVKMLKTSVASVIDGK